MAAIDYGRDVSCTASLKTGRYSTGPRLVGEALYRRFTTPRGMLRGGEDEAVYGLDLSALVGSTDVASVKASLPGRIRAEALKDERVEDVATTILVTTSGPSTTFTITIAGTVKAGGTFALRLAVSAVTVALLGLTAEAA